MSVPVNVSKYLQLKTPLSIISSQPFIHRPPTPHHPLVDDPLVVPDAALVADGVEAVAVGVSSPGYIDHPEESRDVVIRKTWKDEEGNS